MAPLLDRDDRDGQRPLAVCVCFFACAKLEYLGLSQSSSLSEDVWSLWRSVSEDGPRYLRVSSARSVLCWKLVSNHSACQKKIKTRLPLDRFCSLGAGDCAAAAALERATAACVSLSLSLSLDGFIRLAREHRLVFQDVVWRREWSLSLSLCLLEGRRERVSRIRQKEGKPLTTRLRARA